jgi:hypothetical protein
VKVRGRVGPGQELILPHPNQIDRPLETRPRELAGTYGQVQIWNRTERVVDFTLDESIEDVSAQERHDRQMRAQREFYESQIANLRARYERQLEMARQVYSHRSIVESPSMIDRVWMTESDPRLSPVFFSAHRIHPADFNPGAIAPGEVVSAPNRTVRWDNSDGRDRTAFYEPWLQPIMRDYVFQPEPYQRISPEARERARQLLLNHLNHDQRKYYKRAGKFLVRSSGGTTWELRLDRTTRLTDQHRFCVNIDEPGIPPEDHLLMRKLLLETNEPEFLRVANDLTEMQPWRRNWNYRDTYLTGGF